MADQIDAKDRRQILAFFEMCKGASKEDATEHVKNEAATALQYLWRLLSKYGLDIGDVPELQRQEKEAAKADATAATSSSDPTVLELTHHLSQSYFDVKPHEYVGITLWLLSTHVFRQFQISPRLGLLSPVRGCGKTKVLLFLERLAANPERHDNITAAALIRLIEDSDPTMLLDEGDNLGLRIDRQLRSVLNSGHLAGGCVTRTIDGKPQKFSTFAPAAIAAIGTLPLPLLQRSVIIQMQRSLRTDLKTIEEMKTPEAVQRFEALYQLIKTWAAGVTRFDPDPELPKVLRGRTADNWRVLPSIADSFGSSHWSDVAREAAKEFAVGCFDEDACVALLYDIRIIFRRLSVDRIKSADLVVALNDLEDGMGIWSAWRGEANDKTPHPITQGEVAALLKLFDRNWHAKPMHDLGSREERGSTARGYFKKDFELWWRLYCPENTQEDTRENTAVVLPLRPKAGGA
jgi:hypothetical protein